MSYIGIFNIRSSQNNPVVYNKKASKQGEKKYQGDAENTQPSTCIFLYAMPAAPILLNTAGQKKKE